MKKIKMNELQLLQKLGMATSPELQQILEKSIQATIRQLNKLEMLGEIKIIIFSSIKHRRRIYITNELYDNLF
jgi:hypothetical protein|tara:strand:+ start:2721 stop:2939 length:219 start_codon:yes stop_codon:yes gene_type:complete